MKEVYLQVLEMLNQQIPMNLIFISFELTIAELIGQIFGIIATVFGFLSFQVKGGKKLLLMQICVASSFTVHYLFIGAFTAAAMNVVGIVRNISYYHKDKKFYHPKLFPLLFTLLAMISGILTMTGWHSLLVIAGLTINAFCLSLKNPQNIRKSILITSPMVLIYDIIEKSAGGIVFETVAIVSAVIGIIRYRKHR